MVKPIRRVGRTSCNPSRCGDWLNKKTTPRLVAAQDDPHGGVHGRGAPWGAYRYLKRNANLEPGVLRSKGGLPSHPIPSAASPRGHPSNPPAQPPASPGYLVFQAGDRGYGSARTTREAAPASASTCEAAPAPAPAPAHSVIKPPRSATTLRTRVCIDATAPSTTLGGRRMARVRQTKPA